MNLEILTERTGRATALQLAADGRWEDALVLDSAWEATQDEARHWTHGSEDVALEVFFGDVGSGEAFLGLRLTGLDAEGKAEAIRRVCAAVHDFRAPTLLEVVEVVRAGVSDSLFAGACAFAEVGVVNAWKSIGSCRVWDKGEPPPKIETLNRRLARHGQLLRPHPLPVAAELAFDVPHPHWIGIPVSDRERPGYTLNLGTLAGLLEEVLGNE